MGQTFQTSQSGSTGNLPSANPPGGERAGSSSLAASALANARIGVLGHGDNLARTLGLLHRMGARCTVWEDAYQAACEVARHPDTFFAVVVILPCCYQAELAVISTIRTYARNTRVYVADAEQHVSMLTGAMRLGATGLLTQAGVELFAEPAGYDFDQSVGAEGQGDVLVTDEPGAAAEHLSALADGPVVTSANVDEEELEGEEFDDSPLAPVEPILSAEELHALLHDDEVRSTTQARGRR